MDSALLTAFQVLPSGHQNKHVHQTPGKRQQEKTPAKRKWKSKEIQRIVALKEYGCPHKIQRGYKHKDMNLYKKFQNAHSETPGMSVS